MQTLYENICENLKELKYEELIEMYKQQSDKHVKCGIQYTIRKLYPKKYNDFLRIYLKVRI